MTDNHTELCERLRSHEAMVMRGLGYLMNTCSEAAELIEKQAARIQQQALEYVSLFDQCSEHLARIAKLEFLLDSERSTNKALSDENALLADRQPHELLVKIADLEKERDALKADAERLDSGCIVTHERDEFGAEYECERRGVDLRARIDAAMEINKRQSERPDWAECESRGPLVRNSLKHRASELMTAANKCRRAYQKDFMRIPLEWLADAYDEAAAALNRRLSSIAALQAEKDAK